MSVRFWFYHLFLHNLKSFFNFLLIFPRKYGSTACKCSLCYEQACTRKHQNEFFTKILEIGDIKNRRKIVSSTKLLNDSYFWKHRCTLLQIFSYLETKHFWLKISKHPLCMFRRDHFSYETNTVVIVLDIRSLFPAERPTGHFPSKLQSTVF